MSLETNCSPPLPPDCGDRPCGWEYHLPGVGVVAVFSRRAQYLELVTDRGNYPMRREGHWWVSPEPLPLGTRYQYRVDDGPLVPDPRATRRPDGVHGASQTWWPQSASTFDAGDLIGKVFYELHVGTFTPEGTFDAAITRLDYLLDLGVEVIEVMPVAAFPGQFGWGYDGVSLYSAHEPYGGPDGLFRFVQAAHERGVAVCLDLVLNHLGSVGNYIAELDDYYSHTHATPWGPAFDLDGDNAAHTRDFLIGAARYWLRDFGFDALRLDAVHALIDSSEHHFLRQLAQEVRTWETETGRTFTLVAESDLNDPTMVIPADCGGMGMDAQWDDDLHHALHAVFTGESHGYYEDFADRQALTKAYEEVFFHNGIYSTFRHRNWGKPVSKEFDRRRFVISSQNHDQVGNRALGDRPSRCLSLPSLATQAALTLLSPFTVMLFQGEEWAATSPFLFFSDQEGDPQMEESMRCGRQREFASHGWDRIYGQPVSVPDPTARSTFLESKLDWDELRSSSGQAMHRWYRDLLAYRRELAGKISGHPVALRWDGQVGYLSYGHLDPAMVVAFNRGDSAVTVADVGSVELLSSDYFSLPLVPSASPVKDGEVHLGGGHCLVYWRRS